MIHLIGIDEDPAEDMGWFTCLKCGCIFRYVLESARRRKKAMDLVAEHVAREH